MSFDEQVNYCVYCGKESDEPHCSKECFDKETEEKIMKITREDFRQMGCNYDRVDYIKKNNPLVSKVYSTSIYFINAQTHISWNYEPEDYDLDCAVLRAINAACNTEFEFVNNEDKND